MTLNATLLVQVFNFGIAYIAVYFLLLKPALATTAQEEELSKKLAVRVADAQKTVERLHDTEYQVWHASHMFFVHESPKGVSRVRKPIPLPDVAVAHTTAEEKEKQVQALERALVTQIKAGGGIHD